MNKDEELMNLGGERSGMEGVGREEVRNSIIIFKLYFKTLDRKVRF